jgi:AraC-like DNA-binding protein
MRIASNESAFARKKQDVMTAEESFRQCVADSDLPPLTAGDTLHRDGMGLVSQCWGPMMGSESLLPDLPMAFFITPIALQDQGQTTPGQSTHFSMMVGSMCLVPAIDWKQAAACVTFALDPRLLLAPARAASPGATGELVWVPRDARAASLAPAVRPVRIVHTAGASHHIALVPQAASEIDGGVGSLYAESLADALAVHFLRRYAACRPAMREGTGSLAPAALWRTLAYIQAHLEEPLPLAVLAAVVQLSPNHFARLFKQATGRTPHHYVLDCRIMRARQLLAETDLPLSAIGLQVGWTDQPCSKAARKALVPIVPVT